MQVINVHRVTISKCRSVTHSRGALSKAQRYVEYVVLRLTAGARPAALPNPSQPRLTNSIKMTNAQKLIGQVEIVGTNLNHEPLVALKKNPYLGNLIIRQSEIKLSLGVPTMETMLFDAESGKRVFTARDEDNFATAKAIFSTLEFDCNNKAIEKAKLKTIAVVAELGHLGC